MDRRKKLSICLVLVSIAWGLRLGDACRHKDVPVLPLSREVAAHVSHIPLGEAVARGHDHIAESAVTDIVLPAMLARQPERKLVYLGDLLSPVKRWIRNDWPDDDKLEFIEWDD